jgi:acyl-CoA thioesterase-1
MNKIIVIVGVLAVLVGIGWWIVSGDDVAPVVSVADNGANKIASEASVKIIAFGDSLTAGYGVSQAEAYPAQLEAALLDKGYDVVVINSGVSGETTRGNLERANFIRTQDPDIVILGIGGNDALRALPLEETEKNMRATVEILQTGEQSPRVVLLQMQAPLNTGRAYKETFDGLYNTIADDAGLVLVPFITEDIFLVAENKLADGIHYNQAGYEKVVTEYLLPALEQELQNSI